MLLESVLFFSTNDYEINTFKRRPKINIVYQASAPLNFEESMFCTII